MTWARRTRKFFATAAFLVAATLPGFAEELRIYNWADYVDPAVLDDFTKETGIKVVYDVFDTNDTLQTKLFAGNSGYDVVVPTASTLPRLIKAGVLQKLDKDRIPNLKYAWPEISNKIARYDAGNDYAAVYMWGTVGIAYVKEKIDARLPNAPVDSWKLIFDPSVFSKFADCGIYMYDSQDDMIPLAMNYAGIDPLSTNSDDMKKAEEILLSIRPSIQKFTASEQVAAIANGDICLTIGTGGVFLQAQERARSAGKNLTIIYTNPVEGTNLWFDTLAIPADAPNPDAAHKFIDFVYRPEIAARLSNFVKYANGNLASQETILPELKNNPAVYPPEAIIEKSFGLLPYEQSVQKMVTRIWTRVKAGR